MAVDKNVLAVALLGKNEASYSGSAAITGSTDAILVSERPDFALEYAYAGDRPMPPGSAGRQYRVGPSGRVAKSNVKILGQGAGATYTLSVVPPNGLHAMLQGAGFSGSMEAATWKYSPLSADSSLAGYSLALDLYSRGEKRSIKGAYSDLVITGDSAAPVVFDFAIQGLVSMPVAASKPALVYPYKGIIPPKNDNISLSIGGTTSLKVRNWKFELGREISARVDINSAGGHAGFAPGRRNPKFSVTIEAPLLTTFDAYNQFLSATQNALSLQVGSVANNILALSLPQTQLMEVKDGVEGDNIATLDLVFDVVNSGPNTNDDIILTFE